MGKVAGVGVEAGDFTDRLAERVGQLLAGLHDWERKEAAAELTTNQGVP
jgi:hypothetical protein